MQLMMHWASRGHDNRVRGCVTVIGDVCGLYANRIRTRPVTISPHRRDFNRLAETKWRTAGISCVESRIFPIDAPISCVKLRSLISESGGKLFAAS